MKNKHILRTVIVLLVSLLTTTGCANIESSAQEIKIEPSVKTVKKIVLVEDTVKKELSKAGIENNLSSTIGNTKNTSIPSVTSVSGLNFRYTGLPADNKTVTQQGFTAVILNDSESRPQSGIINADIVYEVPTTKDTTAYVGVYQSTMPTDIGPIGNTTSAIGNIVQELNLPHISLNSLHDIQSINPKSASSVFYDNTTKKAPYNNHINIVKLGEYFKNKKFEKPSDTAFHFGHESQIDRLNKNATIITIKPTTNTVANFEYRINKYLKRVNDDIERDFDTYEQIAVDNIVVQFTDVIEEKNSVNIRQDGKGRALLFAYGKVQDIYWEKNKENKTVLRDEDNNEVKLLNGKTWWYILDNNKSVEYKLEYNTFDY